MRGVGVVLLLRICMMLDPFKCLMYRLIYLLGFFDSHGNHLSIYTTEYLRGLGGEVYIHVYVFIIFKTPLMS